MAEEKPEKANKLNTKSDLSFLFAKACVLN